MTSSECVICYDQVTESESCRRFLCECKIVTHKECIEKCESCPFCRTRRVVLPCGLPPELTINIYGVDIYLLNEAVPQMSHYNDVRFNRSITETIEDLDVCMLFETFNNTLHYLRSQGDMEGVERVKTLSNLYQRWLCT